MPFLLHLHSYSNSGVTNGDSVGIEVDGKNFVLTERVAGKRSFNYKTTNLTRHGDKPAKLAAQSGTL